MVKILQIMTVDWPRTSNSDADESMYNNSQNCPPPRDFTRM